MELSNDALFVLIMIMKLVYGIPPNNRLTNGVQLYLSSSDSILPNYSILQGGNFFNFDWNYDGIIDALYCQSANSGSNIGVWYYPNGTQVPIFTGGFNDRRAPSPLFSKRFSGQIALARKDGLAGYEGLYRCVIPDENSASQTLVIGIYRGATYRAENGPDADPSMKFSLITPRFVNPPVFTLSFNVTHGPPTNITCTIGTSPLTMNNTDLSRVIIRGPRVTKVQVTVTVRMKQAGTYRCTVSNARVTDDAQQISGASSASLLFITTPDIPDSFTATRLNTGLTHVRLLWSSVPGVVGYEVLYEVEDGNSDLMSIANITGEANTMLDITSGLSLRTKYNFYIISYGKAQTFPSRTRISFEFTIPTFSDASVTTITSATKITLKWSPPSFVPQRYSIIRKCCKFCRLGHAVNVYNLIASSPYEFTGITPGSNCSFTLYAIYGHDIMNISKVSTATVSSSAPSITNDLCVFILFIVSVTSIIL